MIKTLTPQGNGWILIIPKEIIQLMGLIPETSKLKFKILNKIVYIQEIEAENPNIGKYLIRSLRRKNTSWGLYMPNSILELIDVNPETDKLNLEIQDNVLIIKKA